MLRSSFRPYTVTRLFGVPLRVHPSLALMCLPLALFVSGLVRSTAPGAIDAGRLMLALLVPAIYAASLLLHELGHLITLRSFGIEVESVTLNAWGGRTRVSGKGPGPAVDGAVAATGPAVTLLLSFLGIICMLALKRSRSGQILPEEIALMLAILNLMMLPGCLVPAWPADGYRVMRAIVWALCRDAGAATRVACWLSLGAVGLMLELGALILRGSESGAFAAGIFLIGMGIAFLLPSRQVIALLRTPA